MIAVAWYPVAMAILLDMYGVDVDEGGQFR